MLREFVQDFINKRNGWRARISFVVGAVAATVIARMTLDSFDELQVVTAIEWLAAMLGILAGVTFLTYAVLRLNGPDHREHRSG